MNGGKTTGSQQTWITNMTFRGYGERRCRSGCFVDFFMWTCRIWGILTAIGLWGVGVETAYRQHLLGAYLLVIAALTSLFESIFLINFWVRLCIQEDHNKCVRFWGSMLWLDNWRKGILYFVFSIGCFIKPKEEWLAIITGVMLVVAATLYSIKTYTSRVVTLAEDVNKNQTYDRFDEIQDDIEENLGDAVPEFPQGETVADQDEIMDV